MKIDRRKKRTFDERVKEEAEAMVRLQKEREESREYNLFSWWEEWIYIAEIVWHKMKKLKQYRLKWYEFGTRNVIFELIQEWVPIYE